MGTSTGQFITALTADHEVIVIGGLAVIAHGFNRPTKDADVWLHPMDSPQAWAQVLEGLVRERWLNQLPTADPATARGLLDRFVDWRTCEAALQNPNPEVREMALNHLHEFAADGDPFSQALLEEREIP